MVLYLMPYKVSVCGLSDVGLVRHNNEDVWSELPEENLYVLADGMGGHRAGEIAAKETIENFCALFKARFYDSDKKLQTVNRIINKTIQDVNQLVYQMGIIQDELRGMGTTLCCVLVHPEGLVYAHVGDSRIYRLRENKLTPLTRDHSLRRELIDSGQLDEGQAADFAYNNVITKAIGTEPYVNPEIDVDTIQSGDTILLCTDGLSDMVDDEKIEQIMKKKSSLSDIAKDLIKEAKKRGGNDNVTVVVVSIQ